MEAQRFEQRLLENLERDRQNRPCMQAADWVKFVFQGMLGVGHNIRSLEDTEKRLREEIKAVQPDAAEALVEPLSPAWFRVNLRRAKAEGIPAEWIACMMVLSDGTPEWTRDDVFRVCRQVAEEDDNCDRQLLDRILDPNWLPGHSEAYHAVCRPAYRVLSSAWKLPLQALCSIAHGYHPGVLITLDGPCASGKTSLAAQLARILDADIVHTDDFVVPHAQKTPERLAVPGGNCDWERLVREVLAPWKAGQGTEIRVYDCHRDCFRATGSLLPGRTLILEGSYANLPAIRRLADTCLFLNVPFAERWRRLEARESPDALKGFRERWIPLENAYFQAYNLPDAVCTVLAENEE